MEGCIKALEPDADLAKDKLLSLVEAIQPGSTSNGTMKTHACTDVVNFQIFMGHALSRAPATFKRFGCGHIADTELTHKKQLGDDPPDMPIALNDSGDETTKAEERKAWKQWCHCSMIVSRN